MKTPGKSCHHSYGETSKAEFDALEAKLKHNEDYDYKYWKDKIHLLVEEAIIIDYYYQQGGLAQKNRPRDIKSTPASTRHDTAHSRLDIHRNPRSAHLSHRAGISVCLLHGGLYRANTTPPAR